MNTTSVPTQTASTAADAFGGGSPARGSWTSSERLATRLGEVVPQARQLERAADLIADDLRADPTATYEQPVVDERLDGSPDRRLATPASVRRGRVRSQGTPPSAGRRYGSRPQVGHSAGDRAGLG